MIFSSLITRTNSREQSGYGIALLPAPLLVQHSSESLFWLGFQSEQ